MFRCKICGREEAENRRALRDHVDADHDITDEDEPVIEEILEVVPVDE